MPAPKKVSRLQKHLVSVAVLPDGLGLHSRRGCYSSKTTRRCNPGPTKADPSCGCAATASSVWSQGREDLINYCIFTAPRQNWCLFCIQSTLCHSVTAQDFGALHFCEIGYTAFLGFVVVFVVVAMVVAEASEKGALCLLPNMKGSWLRKCPCSYSVQTHQFFPNASVIQRQESLS